MLTLIIFPNSTGKFKERMQILAVCLLIDAAYILPNLLKK